MQRAQTAPELSPEAWASTTEEWSQGRFHNCFFPSGRKCVIQFASLGALALADAIPSDFADIGHAELTHALGATGYFAEQVVAIDAEEISDDEKVAKQTEITARYGRMLKWLVAEHVLVEPKVTVKDLSSERFPLEDLEWLYSIATRTTNVDGRGRRLGVASVDVLATFPQEHGCAPDCEHCLAVLDAHSTADLGSL